MVGEHFDRSEIRSAQVVDESSDVPVSVGIYAKRVTVLERRFFLVIIQLGRNKHMVDSAESQ